MLKKGTKVLPPGLWELIFEDPSLLWQSSWDDPGLCGCPDSTSNGEGPATQCSKQVPSRSVA